MNIPTPFSLRLGHTQGKTIINRFLRPSCRFATLKASFQIFGWGMRTHSAQRCVDSDASPKQKDTHKECLGTGICLALRGFAWRNGEAEIRPHSARCREHLRCVDSDASAKKYHPNMGGVYHIREFRLRRRVFAEPLVSELPDGFRLKCEPIAQDAESTCAASIPTHRQNKRTLAMLSSLKDSF